MTSTHTCLYLPRKESLNIGFTVLCHESIADDFPPTEKHGTLMMTPVSQSPFHYLNI